MGLIPYRLSVSFTRIVLVVLGILVSLLVVPLITVMSVAGAGSESLSRSLVRIQQDGMTVTTYHPDGSKDIDLTVSSTWPISGVVTQEFGNPGPLYDHGHTGIDIADPRGRTGRPITVFMSGTVSKVVDTDNAYGRYVFVDHGNSVTSQYWHAAKIHVRVGQRVTPGDHIASEGSTGISTGPHLHFEIQVHGIPVNPRSFIAGEPR